MDALGTIKQPVVLIPQPAQPVLPALSQAPTLPVIGSGGADDVSFDAQNADDQRLANLAQAARNVPQPLGSQAFTMFKDATGQVITRFRDINSGRVTYIPEPNLLRLANATAGSGQSLLNITA